MMVCLLLYAYCVGVFSSRKSALACERNLAFVAIVGAERPDFRTISDCRKLHLEACKEVFVQVVRLAAASGFVKLGNVSTDGTKIQGNASRHKAMSYGYMKKEVERLREDIEALSNALYKIPKTVEKFGERLLLAPQHVEGLNLSKQTAMLQKAAETVVVLVKELRAGVNLEKVKAQNDQLQHIEAEADDLMLESLSELYTGDHASVKVVYQKDLFELLEKIFDRCRDAGNVVFRIVLKHS